MLQPLRLGVLSLLPLLAAGPALAQTMPADGAPQLIRLADKPGAALRQLPVDGRQLLRQELGLRPTDDLRPLRTETDERGDVHERFQQYFKGVKVEHGQYTVHRAAGVLSGEFKPVPATLGTKPALSEAAALRAALHTIGARRYMWDDAAAEAGLRRLSQDAKATYRPSGELVVVADYRQGGATGPLVLAWKFNIYAQEPLSRAYVYVDAHTGAVVLQDAIIKHAHGPAAGNAASARPQARPAAPRGVASSASATFETRYMGTRAALTDQFNGSYRLRDYTRAAGIETYNLRTGTNLGAAVDFTDTDNNWTAAEYNNAAKDNAALDAHFGSQATYDYWMGTHGRNSINGSGGKFINYVHLRVRFDNAYWDGSAMNYGDGGTLFRPLTALDVCGHETGHGICQATANLVYANESGALNEGFSDIWGAAVEYSVDPTKQTWMVGEDVCLNASGLRSMSDPLNPGVLSPCPANYKGRLWAFGTADNGGVHTNSGVLNHWFYILSVGKTGTNEQQQAYAVAGIGIDKAARIAYRAERLYLTANSDYRSTRMFTIQAATDLYGANSAEVTAVTDAWFAVGLGTSSAAAAGTQAQCQPDDAAVLTASASATSLCAGETLNLTATAAYPTTRRLRSATGATLPDAATTYTAVPVFSTTVANGTTLQHGLETLYRSNYGDLQGVRVRLSHAQPGDVALRLAVRNSSGTTTYVNLATALPTASSPATPSTLDLTFADNATATLPTTMSGTSLTGTYRPTAALNSLVPGTLAFISLEAKDGTAGNTGTIISAELLFRRSASDVPSVRWIGPGLDVAGLTATTQPAGPAAGGTATYRYTALASDPYFGCTSLQTVNVNVSQPLLTAAAPQPELCAGRGQAFGPVALRVTADDSIAGQTYRWTGPNGYAATGKRRSPVPATGGLLRYTVSTATPGSNCTNQRVVNVLARRPVAAAPAGIDSVACAGGTARLRSRPFENQLVGPYEFTGSTAIPDYPAAGVRIPLTVAGTAEGFFDLRGIRVSLNHTYVGDLALYLIAPDGTRVLLSMQNGAGGTGYQNTLFVDSVGARVLSNGASPFAGSWQVDDPEGFAKLRTTPMAGTWNLWVIDGGPADVGVVTAWGIVTRGNNTIWSGPNGLTATGDNVLAAVPATAGRYRFIGTTAVPGGCTFRDTVDVRVTSGSEWRRRQNTDLALAANWTCLPTATTDAEIRGTATAQPVLSAGLVQVRNLTLRAGTALALNGGTLEVYGSLTLETGASISGTDGTLSLRGATTGLNAPTTTALAVPRLLVNLPAAADTARLAQSLTVGKALTLQRGILKTQSSALTLTPGATITETATAYVSGRVLASGPVSASTTQDFGGVGVVLSQASASVSSVSVARVTDQAIGRAPARTSIRRYYELSYLPNIAVSATVRQSYRDAELNGLANTSLQPYRAGTLAGPWVPVAATAQNPSLNYVEGSGSILGIWTLSTPTAMLPTRNATAAGFSVQAVPVPFGAGGFSLALQALRPQHSASVAVYDLTGRLLVQRPLAIAAGTSTVALPEAGRLAAGVYVVRVVLDGEAQTLRVTRE
ncbi:M4 family metallopeptidase [Hymenobacter sp. DH14]|uniref:M4 family metallopeptidase n=1 Tax=Hymenobacter cyanobacteriorum TaxID=2926463 RepID=A0A9X1VF29_9BACT|nr:M4 family metallopeptidase [Hymenobacter cyanobacteriorum]MCI1186962.1 M4 family metallopeptidase [Hymenobacter cyanobacteriorum]